MMDIDISFPFSATIPQIILFIGQLFHEEGIVLLYVIGIGLVTHYITWYDLA
jgi:hypothetical protein